jgi:hypothetical protein
MTLQNKSQYFRSLKIMLGPEIAAGRKRLTSPSLKTHVREVGVTVEFQRVKSVGALEALSRFTSTTSKSTRDSTYPKQPVDIVVVPSSKLAQHRASRTYCGQPST